MIALHAALVMRMQMGAREKQAFLAPSAARSLLPAGGVPGIPGIRVLAQRDRL